MTLLAVDSGNTSVNWAVFVDGKWQGHDRAGREDSLSALTTAARSADMACACNVGGPGQKQRIAEALTGCELQWIETMEEGGGVRNCYEPPQSLGVDRWCALLGLRRAYGSGVAILAGTAVTVDLLPPDGVFAGGLIVPGVDAMRSAVEASTALGPFARGDLNLMSASPKPTGTVSAVTAGAMHAIAGAAMSYLGADVIASSKIVIAGGYSLALARMLQGAVVDPDLVFRGIEVAARN